MSWGFLRLLRVPGAEVPRACPQTHSDGLRERLGRGWGGFRWDSLDASSSRALERWKTWSDGKPAEQVGGQSTTRFLEALPTASMNVWGGRPRGCHGRVEEGKTVTLAELQSGEDGAERRRQGRALETGARVSVRSYTTGARWVSESVTTGPVLGPARHGDLRASGSSGPGAGCREADGPGEGRKRCAGPLKE